MNLDDALDTLQDRVGEWGMVITSVEGVSGDEPLHCLTLHSGDYEIAITLRDLDQAVQSRQQVEVLATNLIAEVAVIEAEAGQVIH